MNLYQFVFGHQPHFVVAEDYGDAEKTISATYGGRTDRIDNLGPYVLISEKCKAAMGGDDE